MRIPSLCLISIVTIIVISILPITTTLSFYDKKSSNQLQNSIMEQSPIIKVQNVLAKFEEQQKQYQGNQTTKIYKDENYGIQFEYPSTVDIVEDRLLTMSDLQLAHVFFEGQFKLPYLTIKIYPLSPNEKTLNDFTSRIVKIKEKTSGLLNNNVSILRSEATTLAGKPAHELEYIDKYYTATENNTSSKMTETKSLSIWTIDNNQAYDLEFKGTTEKYKKHLPLAERIIKSFQIYK